MSANRPTGKRKRKTAADARLEYWKFVAVTEPEWADRPGADWEDPEYMAWVESWTDADFKRLATAVVQLSRRKVRREH